MGPQLNEWGWRGAATYVCASPCACWLCTDPCQTPTPLPAQHPGLAFQRSQEQEVFLLCSLLHLEIQHSHFPWPQSQSSASLCGLEVETGSGSAPWSLCGSGSGLSQPGIPRRWRKRVTASEKVDLSPAPRWGILRTAEMVKLCWLWDGSQPQVWCNMSPGEKGNYHDFHLDSFGCI